MSNTPNFRPRNRNRYDSHGVSKMCVFCEITQLADHIDTKVIPTLNIADQINAQSLVAQIRRDASSLEEIALRRG